VGEMNSASVNVDRCTAMIEADIKNPISQKGIDFCVEKCPYDCCVVVEIGREKKVIEHKRKISLSVSLRSRRVTVKDIALIIGEKEITIRRYLKQRELL
jgi:hypothetical protein